MNMFKRVKQEWKRFCEDWNRDVLPETLAEQANREHYERWVKKLEQPAPGVNLAALYARIAQLEDERQALADELQAMRQRRDYWFNKYHGIAMKTKTGGTDLVYVQHPTNDKV